MRYVEIKAPAKINFGLSVVSKREDGFHNLETFFYPICDLFDIIKITKSDRFSFYTNVDWLKNDPTNLVIKAVHILQNFAKQEFQIDISLEKLIPVGAGLGGGSSDAAAMLISLNDMFELNLSFDQLKGFALQLGSDVPFFIKAKPAIGRSRGELLDFVDVAIEKPILIVNPGIHVSTKEAFANIIPKKPDFCYDYFKNWDISKLDELKGILINDFEKQVHLHHPQIAEIKNILYSNGAQFAQMTGTGSTVFGIFNSVEEVERAKNLFPEKYFRFISHHEF